MTTVTGTWKVARIRGHRVRFQHTGTRKMTPWVKFKFDPNTKDISFVESAYAMQRFFEVIGDGVTQAVTALSNAIVGMGKVVGEAATKFNTFVTAVKIPPHTVDVDIDGAVITVVLTDSDLPSYNVPTLRKAAQELGISGTSRMTKDVLIRAILDKVA